MLACGLILNANSKYPLSVINTGLGNLPCFYFISLFLRTSNAFYPLQVFKFSIAYSPHLHLY